MKTQSKQPGRKRKKASEKRSQLLAIKLTSEEMKNVKRSARQVGETVSSVVRGLIDPILEGEKK